MMDDGDDVKTAVAPRRKGPPRPGRLLLALDDSDRAALVQLQGLLSEMLGHDVTLVATVRQLLRDPERIVRYRRRRDAVPQEQDIQLDIHTQLDIDDILSYAGPSRKT